MDEWISLSFGIAVTLIISTAIVLTIRKPLNALLDELCETERQGKFWGTFTNIMLYLTPLLSTILFGSLGDTSLSAMLLTRNLLGSSLGGAFATMIGIGLVIVRFIPPPKPPTQTSGKSYSEEFWSDAKD